MNIVWYVVLGGVIVLVSMVIGLFIGSALTETANDDNDYDDDDYDYNDNDDQEFIDKCLQDIQVQAILDTYSDGVVRVGKSNLNNLIIRMMSDYILQEVDVKILDDSEFFYFQINKDDYRKYYNVSSKQENN